jgi:hypothetical protein
MTNDQLALALYDAITEKKDVAVLRQTIIKVEKKTDKYYLRFGNKKHPISKAFALNAIKWGTKLITLPQKYQIGNVQFSI